MTLTSPLTREAQAVRDLLAALRDIIGDDEDFAVDVIEGETNFLEIVNALLGQDGQDKAHIAALDAYAKDLAARKERIKLRRERRRAALLKAIQTAEIKGSLRCALGTVGLTTTQPGVVVTDEKLIPKKYWKTPEPELDKRALLADLKRGDRIGGACLSNGGVALSIRMA